ncbi:MAG: class I SAM-dependent methyltransferase [Bacteroidota bacterium]
MAWYEDWFDSDAYELVYDQRDLSEARRLADLIERTAQPTPGARVLDVACGRGRHSRILAARGYDVTGVDLSENALRSARRRAAREGLSVTFQQADMRALPFEAAFDGAVNLFTSFGYFDAESDHQRVIDGVARALRPGGWFVQDFLSAPYLAAHLVAEDERTVEGPDGQPVRIVQRRRIEAGPGGPRVNKEITLHRSGNTHTFAESVRLLGAADFRRMYAAAGLDLAATFGDYAGGPYSEASPRLILVARKAAGP